MNSLISILNRVSSLYLQLRYLRAPLVALQRGIILRSMQFIFQHFSPFSVIRGRHGRPHEIVIFNVSSLQRILSFFLIRTQVQLLARVHSPVLSHDREH